MTKGTRGPKPRPLNERRVDQIIVKLTPAEKSLIGDTAKQNKVTISDFVRDAVFNKIGEHDHA